jgi:hypothetical protein
MTRREAIVTAVLPMPFLALFKCNSGSTLIGALDVVEVAADASIPVLQAFAPQLGPFATIAIDYAKGIANAAALSITEAQTADTNTVKYGKIFAYFAAVAALSIPAGIGTEVQAVISAITAAVQLVLTAIGHAPAPTVVKTAAQNPLLLKYQSQVKALGSDSARISDVMAHAAHVRDAHL